MSTIPPETETSYTPGPGQNTTAPKRDRGEICEQQPGMRAPISGVYNAYFRFSQILGKKSYFLGPTIFKIPQPN